MVNILIIDDHAVSTRLTSRMLHMSGITEIETCNKGEDAINFILANRDSLNLVITDWNMPFVNGEDICSITYDLQIPTIVLTNEYTSQQRVQAKLLGVVKYLTKPVNRVDLTKAVSDVIDLYYNS